MSVALSDSLFASAAARARHIADAVAWFESELHGSQDFRSAFDSLVNSLTEAAMSEDGRSGVRQVHFMAVGKSGGVAQLVVSMLASVGIQARYLHPTEAFHGDLGAVCERDAVVLISNFGRTTELLQVVPKLQERQCVLHLVTSRSDSPLAQLCERVLLLPAVEEKCPLNQAPITSTVTTLALCQLLVAATMEQRSYRLERYARNHPGGAIGKRIFVRVDELMAKGDNLPVVGKSESFQACVSAMTRHHLGALVVAEHGKLEGIICERELRHAMQRWGAQVFEKTAVDFMNPKPKVIQAGTLAVDALRMMESHYPNPLNVLPVVSDEGEALGLLHLHILVKEGIALT